MKDQKDIAGFALQSVLKEKFDDLARGVVTIDYKTASEVAEMRGNVKELIEAVGLLAEEIDTSKPAETPEEGAKVRSNEEIYKVAMATYKLADALSKNNAAAKPDSANTPKKSQKVAAAAVNISLSFDGKKALAIVGIACLVVGVAIGHFWR